MAYRWLPNNLWDFSAVGGSYRFVKELYDNRNRSFEDNTMSDWLYGEYDEDKLKEFELLHNIPVVGNYMDYLLDLRSDKEYLNRYGLDYSDIHDPRKLRSVGSGSRLLGSAYNFFSKNIEDLYRDD